MNNLEKKIIDVLKDVRENHGVVGIKAEFEAEGTRTDEIIRLKDIISKAGLGLSLKIGGCEAIKDMYEARNIGIERIIAPMVETPYALSKFLKATKFAFTEEERRDVKFLINIETITSCENFDKMLLLPDIDRLNGIVVGRVDLTGSMGLTREDVCGDEVLKATKDVLVKARTKTLETVVGGGVGYPSLPFFKELSGFLDRFETRKVIFDYKNCLGKEPEKGMFKAMGFELLWLKNKKNYYSLIEKEDDQRIGMLETRYKEMMKQAGAQYE